jgi:hypothetical protein
MSFETECLSQVHDTGVKLAYSIGHGRCHKYNDLYNAKNMFISRRTLKTQSNINFMYLNLTCYLPKLISAKGMKNNIGLTQATYKELQTFMERHAQEQNKIVTSGLRHLCIVIRFSIDKSVDKTGSA